MSYLSKQIVEAASVVDAIVGELKGTLLPNERIPQNDADALNTAINELDLCMADRNSKAPRHYIAEYAIGRIALMGGLDYREAKQSATQPLI